ncbi:MAG: hypothetical protein ACO1G4_03815 [Bacteroidota bacterium]|nr:hypothetical protein [Bacteroidia bacterium]HRB53358.1 hypothetical protein [Bacteroidia bacterium]
MFDYNLYKPEQEYPVPAFLFHLTLHGEASEHSYHPNSPHSLE